MKDTMAENLAKKPAKGILKTSTSFEKTEIPKPTRYKETKWDEMNILATLHPLDKDYGHMKIEEPKTPYNWVDGECQSGDEADGIDAGVLAEKIELGAHQPPKFLAQDEEESEEDDEEAPEQKAKRKSFESKRKLHYNEFQAVKLARKLMEEDEEGECSEESGDAAD
ncbi:hypothetical protein B566_EDAN011842 [Ephemera danica]|nr:hypothetical protein B566_EDAN011842 [Ephemera danica]